MTKISMTTINNQPSNYTKNPILLTISTCLGVIMIVIIITCVLPPSQITKGHKMLAKMGWKGQGHGLGKTQQGITKPIEVDSNAYRFGLGCRIYDQYADDDETKDSGKKTTSSNDNNNNNRDRKTMDCDNDDEPAVVSKDADQKQPKRMNRAQRRLQQQQEPQKQQQQTGVKRNWQTKSLMTNNIRTILINYANSEAENDLLFEKNLSSDDRKLVHQEAHKLGLKTRSQGVEPNRFIAVSKKRTSKEIYEAALRNGGQSSKFQLLSTGEQQQPPKK